MKKPSILILPGWQLGAQRFSMLKELLEKKSFQVSIVDFPGFYGGKKLVNPWFLDDYVGFVDGFISEKKIDKPIIIAHSFGGRVALKLLSKDPQRASYLILCGTPGFQVAGLRATLSKRISQQVKPYVTNMWLKKILYRIIGAHDLSRLSGAVRQTFINIIEESLESYMPQVTTPTFLLWGENDSLVPPHVAYRMQQSMPDADIKILPRLRHNFIYQHPDIFVNEFMEYLKAHE